MGLVLSSITQVAIAALIPFIIWLWRYRKEDGSFLSWVGLKGCRFSPLMIGWMAGGLVLTFASLFLMASALPLEKMALGPFAGGGTGVVPAVLVWAIIQTSLSEELFFRGFLAKRLIAAFGMQMGNSIQATIFGLLHLGMVMLVVPDTLLALGVGFATTAFSAIGAYINEQLADGSILPSWIMHASGNVIAGLIAAYGLFDWFFPF